VIDQIHCTVETWPENNVDDPRTSTGLLRLAEPWAARLGTWKARFSVPWWPFEVAPPSLIPPNFAGTPSYLFSTRSRSPLPSVRSYRKAVASTHPNTKLYKQPNRHHGYQPANVRPYACAGMRTNC
jgi:hypothetical protein